MFGLIGSRLFTALLASAVYLDFLQKICLLANVSTRDMYFMHDGASPNVSIAVRQHLYGFFENRLIGHIST